jgi:hypothetical protein
MATERLGPIAQLTRGEDALMIMKNFGFDGENKRSLGVLSFGWS